MPDFSFSIDLHCHPQYKPFGRAHKQAGAAPEPQSTSTSSRSSMWFYDPPSILDKGLQLLFGLTKFSQTNLTASLYGRNLVKAVGLGATEQGFFKNKLGEGLPSDVLGRFASGFGRHRVNAIQNMTDYWKDFENEMKFMDEGLNRPVTIDGAHYIYTMPKNFMELQANIVSNQDENAGSRNKPLIISILCSVEGLHILNCGLENPCKPAEVLKHARDLKSMQHVPWFITFSHHFYNELCGHARSLRKEIGKLTNQEPGIGTGFTPLGLQVLDIILEKNSEGKRILIDIKHMSPQARKEFMQLRTTKYNSEIPVFMSHGVCNGLPTHGATVSNFPELGKDFINELGEDIGGDGKFKDFNEINFYDDEILAMVRSNGILGLQLDERRLANDNKIKNGVKHSVFRNKIMHYRSELLWNQVQYIAELLDHHDLPAWENMAIGSDYDGIVDPLNAFWTAEEFDDLASYLERHAHNYFTKTPERMKNSFNKISADMAMQKIFCDNAWAFFRRWF